MHKFIKLQFTILTIALFLGLSVAPVFAGIGVSPATVSNLRAKPGSTFKQEIEITQSVAEEDMTIKVASDVGNINSWFSFEPGSSFTIPKGQQHYTTTVVVNVPADAEMKEYKGSIRITATPAGEQNTGVAVVKGAKIDVDIIVTNQDITDFVIRAVTIGDVLNNEPILLVIKAENVGNVTSTLTRVTLDVTSLTNQPVAKLEGSDGLDNIAPGETKELAVRIPHKLSNGDYYADAKVYLGDKVLRSEKIAFRVKDGIDKGVSNENNSPLSLSEQQVIKVAILLGSWTVFFGLAAIFVYRKKLLPAERKKAFLAFAFIIYVITTGIIIYLLLLRYKEPSTNSNVQGASTSQLAESKPVEIYHSSTSQSPGEYEVHATPDNNSPVIYTAREGENFDVIQENDWGYKVKLPTGLEGWVAKDNVKSTTSL